MYTIDFIEIRRQSPALVGCYCCLLSTTEPHLYTSSREIIVDFTIIRIRTDTLERQIVVSHYLSNLIGVLKLFVPKS